MKEFCKQGFIFYSLIIFVTACGSGDSSQPVVEPAAYTCGTLVSNETCVTLFLSDNYSSERHFILNIPSSVKANPAIFIMLHGSGGRADSTAERYAFREFVQENGYIGILPNSIVREDGVSTWNAHDATYGINYINDVKFIQQAITTVVEEQNADASRVFVFGWSNGGFMANRLACEIPQSITAIFTLAGNLRDTLGNCDMNANVAINHLHPTGDTTVPFYGDSSKGYISAEEAITRWAEHNNCQPNPITVGPLDLTSDEVGEESNVFVYQDCDSVVDFTVIDGSSHGPQFHTKIFHQYMADFYLKASE